MEEEEADIGHVSPTNTCWLCKESTAKQRGSKLHGGEVGEKGQSRAKA